MISEHMQTQETYIELVSGKKRFSSGTVEGLNNKTKVTMRKSYGFKSFECAQIALYHSMGNLPEPSTVHKFW